MSKFALLIPCFNFARGLPKTFELLERWQAASAREVLVQFIDDGSTDDTHAGLAAFAEKHPSWVRVLRFTGNRGKGAAIRAGFAAVARDGIENVVFTDCDLHYGLSIITEGPLPRLEGADLVVVDRSWCASARHQTLARRLASGFFNRTMQILTGVTFHDSQAGLKALRVSACRPVVDLLVLEGFTFDVELLSVALFYRLRVKQLPVRFTHDYEFPHTSTVKLVRASLSMLGDLVRINLNWKRGRYRSDELTRRVDETIYSID